MLTTTFAPLQVISNPLRVLKKNQLYRILSVFLVCIARHVSLSQPISDLFIYHNVEQEDVMLLDTDDDYGDGSMSDASCEEDGKHIAVFLKAIDLNIWNSVDFEDELSDSDIEQFEDIEPVPAFDEIDSRTDHPSGALIGVLHGEKGATMKFAFLGFFRGKGYTDQNSITAGFKLRSTSFVWLASFLRRCSIQTPNLR